MKPKCPECRTPNPAAARHCSQCGSPLRTDSLAQVGNAFNTTVDDAAGCLMLPFRLLGVLLKAALILAVLFAAAAVIGSLVLTEVAP
jgi:hypothetical protein